jgi:hypothetical protein
MGTAYQNDKRRACPIGAPSQNLINARAGDYQSFNQEQESKMKVYISFGQIHRHEVNGVVFDKDSIAVFESDSESEARGKAFELFGDKFFTSYLKLPDMSYFPRGLIEVNPSDLSDEEFNELQSRVSEELEELKTMQPEDK